jgi:hypothetical protein
MDPVSLGDIANRAAGLAAVRHITDISPYLCLG